MSMDLAKESYSTSPDYFIAGTTIPITTATKEASVALDAHAPVLLTDGTLAKVTATDGTVTTTGIYGITADSAAKGEDCVVYLTGEFFADGLALESDVTADAIEVALREIGIFLK